MTTLLLAEVTKAGLGDTAAKALTAAQQLGAPVHILVAGKNCDAAAQSASALPGVEKVTGRRRRSLRQSASEPMAALIVFARGPITLPSSQARQP